MTLLEEITQIIKKGGDIDKIAENIHVSCVLRIYRLTQLLIYRNQEDLYEMLVDWVIRDEEDKAQKYKNYKQKVEEK